jgi:hypothetical protein
MNTKPATVMQATRVPLRQMRVAGTAAEETLQRLLGGSAPARSVSPASFSSSI